VEVTPLLKGHTFLTKKILLIRIAKEANYYGCQNAIVRSDNYKVYVQGCSGSNFHMKASCSIKVGWKATSINTREVTKANDDPADELLHDSEEKRTDEDKACVKEDDADGGEKAVCQCTPIKSCGIFPLLLKEIMEKPNMCNTEMKHLFPLQVHHQFSFAECQDNDEG
jgi:hypothetical protein